MLWNRGVNEKAELNCVTLISVGRITGAEKRVLFYGPTHAVGEVAENLAVTASLVPIPDSRAEGSSGETAIITIVPNNSYITGASSQKTVTILEDDVVEIPTSGWKLTDLGTFGGYNGKGVAINIVPGGGGRGQVAGFQDNGTSGYKGAFWDNGSYTLRNYPSSWTYFDRAWSKTAGLNKTGTVVGYCYQEVYYSSFQHPSYWVAGSTSPTLLPVL